MALHTLKFKLCKANQARVELTSEYALAIQKLSNNARVWIFDSKFPEIGAPSHATVDGLRVIDAGTGQQVFPKDRIYLLDYDKHAILFDDSAHSVVMKIGHGPTTVYFPRRHAQFRKSRDYDATNDEMRLARIDITLADTQNMIMYSQEVPGLVRISSQGVKNLPVFKKAGMTRISPGDSAGNYNIRCSDHIIVHNGAVIGFTTDTLDSMYIV